MHSYKKQELYFIELCYKIQSRKIRRRDCCVWESERLMLLVMLLKILNEENKGRKGKNILLVQKDMKKIGLC